MNYGREEWWDVSLFERISKESFHYFESVSKIPVDLYTLLNFDNPLIDDITFSDLVKLP